MIGVSGPDALGALADAGVSVWLDDLSRGRLTSGSLAALIADGVRGVTTNPSIFKAALADGDAYAAEVAELAAAGAEVETAVRALTTHDVRQACDLFLPLWAATDGVDGRVSIEVDPRKARDPQGTLAEARALWAEVDRPNLLIKIPATLEALPAITSALAEGLSVNVTLIFSLERYRAVMNAVLVGLEEARARGRDLATIHSVASFFISRVDTAVDARLEALGSPTATALQGSAALANARLAYQAYEEVFAGPRWESLAAAGARPQRPLWASTGVKNPAYPDTLYVTELVAPGTVNTMPEATLRAVRDHAVVTGDTITDGYAEANVTLDALAALGISYVEVTDQLEAEGLAAFEQAWLAVLAGVRSALEAAR